MSKRQPLTTEQLNAHLVQLPGWALASDALEAKFSFPDFATAWAFLSYLALLSERLDHHAELWNVYNQVRVRLATHDPRGISLLDVEMATLLNFYYHNHQK